MLALGQGVDVEEDECVEAVFGVLLKCPEDRVWWGLLR